MLIYGLDEGSNRGYAGAATRDVVASAALFAHVARRVASASIDFLSLGQRPCRADDFVNDYELWKPVSFVCVCVCVCLCVS